MYVGVAARSPSAGDAHAHPLFSFVLVLLIPVKRTREREKMDLCVNGRSKEETKGARMKENEDSDGSSDVCKGLREI